MHIQSKKLSRGLRIASQAAKLSNSHTYKVGAALLKNGKPISTGWNRYSMPKWSFRRKIPTRHAEIHCVGKISEGSVCGCILFIVRIKNNGELGYSKPCNECFNKLKKLNLKDIYYINKIGILTSMKINNEL